MQSGGSPPRWVRCVRQRISNNKCGAVGGALSSPGYISAICQFAASGVLGMGLQHQSRQRGSSASMRMIDRDAQSLMTGKPTLRVELVSRRPMPTNLLFPRVVS